jgi:cellulose synthase operon protein YhjQ
MPLICVASPKGGVGKTTLSANLADALRRAGRRVMALDLDPQNGLRLHFGLPPADADGFTVLLPQRPDWRAALRETRSGVRLLPHGATRMRGALDLWAALEHEPDLLAAPVRAMLANDPDLVVLADTAPGPSPALGVLFPMADLVLTVLLADGASAALLPEVESGCHLGQGALATVVARRTHLVLNGLDAASRLSVAVTESAMRSMGERLLGAIRRDDAVAEALAQQRLLLDYAPDSRAASDLRDIARGVEARLRRALSASVGPAGAEPGAFALAQWALPR